MHKHCLLITGASSGIGYETAKLAAERGHTVIASAPNAELLLQLPDNVAHRCIIDICDGQTIDTALQEIAEAGLKPSCLINNAGYAQPGPVELVDDARLRRQFEVNVFGTLAMTRAAIPLLREQAAQGGPARIITLSSMMGLVSLPFQGIYAASKYALEAAFDALRMELQSSNIDVVLVEPGWITTQFLKTAVSHAPDDWLQHAVYGKALSSYFAISSAAEDAEPTGTAKIAAALAGSPKQVAETVVAALEADTPKTRYRVTGMARWMPRIARALPTRMWDDMQMRQFRAGDA